jgi:sec-independent protein translocase protein TatA
MIGDLLQPTHLLVLLVVALLVFGPKRLPELGRSLGNGLRELRHSLGAHEEAAAEPEPSAPPVPSPPPAGRD